MTDQSQHSDANNSSSGDAGHLDAAKALKLIQHAVSTGLLSKAEVIRAAGGKGRQVAELPEFTFKGSGIAVGVRKLGPFTIDELRLALSRETKPPEPPVVRVYYGEAEDPKPDDPDWKEEYNEADPKYREDMAAYEAEQTEKLGRRVIDTIIEFAVEAFPDKDEVARTRAFLHKMGVPQEKIDQLSDHDVWVKHVCIKTQEDLTDLQNFVLGRSIPSEQHVQAHVDTFQRDVQEEASV